MGGSDFDYRPLLSFGVIILVTGSAFIAMGLLFSSLTRDQIASGVLTFAGMLTLTLVFLMHNNLRGGYALVLKHMSYINLWIESLQGKLVVRDLLFPLSLTVFCLFLTVKVLESRKWK
jgi:ABC-2 type transport system permease protein